MRMSEGEAGLSCAVEIPPKTVDVTYEEPPPLFVGGHVCSSNSLGLKSLVLDF